MYIIHTEEYSEKRYISSVDAHHSEPTSVGLRGRLNRDRRACYCYNCQICGYGNYRYGSTYRHNCYGRYNTHDSYGGPDACCGRKVVVSSKNFTEEFLLGEIYALALENAGVPVDRKMNLGASDIAQAALLKGGASGGIDLYPEYTSTGLTVILKQVPIYDPPAVFAAVKKGYEDQFKLTWLMHRL